MSATPAQPSAASPPPLASFAPGWRAVVIGASGGIGAAFVQRLAADPGCAHVLALQRQAVPGSGLPGLDFDDEASIAAAAAAAAAQVPQGRFQLVINAAGLLHGAGFMPEKKLADLHYAQLLATFRANTFGPALVLRHFSPLLDPQRGVLALLSAKVGSIGDNRLGGWYSYRASKAALNMLVKTAAIELQRSRPGAVLVALHPGTVASRLSQPFRGAEIGRPAKLAAAEMLAVIDGLKPADSGRFIAYDGQALPW